MLGMTEGALGMTEGALGMTKVACHIERSRNIFWIPRLRSK